MIGPPFWHATDVEVLINTNLRVYAFRSISNTSPLVLPRVGIKVRQSSEVGELRVRVRSAKSHTPLAGTCECRMSRIFVRSFLQYGLGYPQISEDYQVRNKNTRGRHLILYRLN